MKNRKLYAALLTGTLAVTMMGTTVFASASYTGTTQFTYDGGTIQPPEGGVENDWMVKYPTSVRLSDSNKAASAADSKTKGVAMKFAVTKKDGISEVTKAEIANGLTITASTATPGDWTETNIKMAGGTSGETVNMQLTSGVTSSQDNFLTTGGTMAVLTVGSSTDEATGYASISNDSKPVSGQSYNQTVIWTVTKSE